MALTTAMFTSLTGLDTSSQLLNVTGNNIANVNTTAFKKSRVSFQTQISRNLRNASAPTDLLGGTNPAQVGLGTQIGAITRNFENGPLQPTGSNTDVAVEGNGFFIVDVNGSRHFTRDGGFTLDQDNNLVQPGSGGLVQGFGVDQDFSIVNGVLGNVNIPIGTLSIAEPTENVQFAGNLNAGGDVATLGAIIDFAAMYTDAAQTTAATAATDLTTILDDTGTAIFAAGDVITLTGATRGGATISDKTFEIGGTATTPDDSGTTVQDFMDFLEAVLGLDDGNGADITLTAGSIQITGNTGLANDLVIDDGDLILNQGTTPSVPFDTTKTQTADGESIRTTFLAYDSLGNPVTVDMTVVLENKDSGGTDWRFYTHSDDDTDLETFLGDGTAQFDNNGQLIAITDSTITVNRNNVGSVNPLQFDINFQNDGNTGAVTALNEVNSQISATFQDGSGIGTLEDFTVSADGTITGVFSNGLLRDLGRIPIAMFANNAGLEEMGGNLFRPTPNSGIPVIVTPTTGGSGRLIGQTVELSNVDLAEEFLNLISASTGFSASSRVLSTSDQLIQELLATIR
ncbi:MAG: flagellar hook-basal body complex protein [Planctomycetota bacterium]